jgi:hypothetical protein
LTKIGIVLIVGSAGIILGIMSVIGVVEDGKIVLPPGLRLATGTRVRIEPLPSHEQGPLLAETLKDYIGIFDDLPSDLARNHDH